MCSSSGSAFMSGGCPQEKDREPSSIAAAANWRAQRYWVVSTARPLPARPSHNETAGRISRGSNLKPIALGMMTYVDDHGGHYPPRMPDPAAGAPYPCKPCRTAPYDWRSYAAPYLSGTTNVTNS